MATAPYDKKYLMEQLDRLPTERRVAFAAACAERLVPAHIAYSTKTGQGDPTTLPRVLDRLWADLAGDRMTQSEVQASIDATMELMLQEDEGPWPLERGPGEDAAAAAAYALQCRQNGESQEARSAASHVFDALDYFLLNRDNPPGGEARGSPFPDLEVEFAHPLMQAELARQDRDIGELLAAGKDDGPAVIARLRDRARAEARNLFG